MRDYLADSMFMPTRRSNFLNLQNATQCVAFSDDS